MCLFQSPLNALLLGRVAAIVAHDSQYSGMAPRGDLWARRGLLQKRATSGDFLGRRGAGRYGPRFRRKHPFLYWKLFFTRVQWNSFVYAVLNVPE